MALLEFRGGRWVSMPLTRQPPPPERAGALVTASTFQVHIPGNTNHSSAKAIRPTPVRVFHAFLSSLGTRAEVSARQTVSVEPQPFLGGSHWMRKVLAPRPP